MNEINKSIRLKNVNVEKKRFIIFDLGSFLMLGNNASKLLNASEIMALLILFSEENLINTCHVSRAVPASLLKFDFLVSRVHST